MDNTSKMRKLMETIESVNEMDSLIVYPDGT